jgi:predicted DCC family thiol-disulfide oxidoreductase YuxK
MSRAEKISALARLRDGFVERYLSLDPRWLGVFRLLLGSLIFLDVARRWLHVRDFYSNDGLLPNHYSLFRPMGVDVFSFFHAFSTVGEASILFALCLTFVALFAAGWRTRLFHVLTAFTVTSLNARNIFVENGGTVVVNILTIWTLFLPLGRRLSVDAVVASLRARRERTADELNDRSDPAPDDRRAVSLVVLVLILQWSVIYFFNAITKSGVGWRNGTSLHWFWHQDRIITWFGAWAREHVPLWGIRSLTYGTLGVEYTLAFVMLVPFLQKWTRRLGLLLAVGLHGGIALSSRLGPFSYVMSIFFVMFLGDDDWRLLARWFGREARRRRVVYDADCGLCLQTCRLLKRLDPFARLEFVANDDRERLPASLDAATLESSVAAIDARGRVFFAERAVFEIARALPLGILLVWWLRVPLLRRLGRALYFLIARNRIRLGAWFGWGACGTAPATPAAPVRRVPGPVRDEIDGFVTVLREGVVLLLAFAVAAQVSMENHWLGQRGLRIKRPEWMNALVNYPRIFQGWRMFAPEPPYEDGRVVVDGRTVTGKKLDPLTGREPEFDPYTPTGWGHDQFWCDYHNRIRFPGHVGNRQHLRSWLLGWHQWYGKPDDRLVAFDVWWVQDKSPPPPPANEGALDAQGKPIMRQLRGEPLPPQKLLSHGVVVDSGATPWLQRSGNRR